MASNVMLCRWAGGWHEVEDAVSVAAHGRREALLAIGAIPSVPETETVANEQLSIFADVRDQFGAYVETRDIANMPYWAVDLGDTAVVPDDTLAPTDVRLLSITVTEDNEGNPIFEPVFNDVIFQQDQTFAENLKKMANGTLGGNSTVAQPASFQATPAPNLAIPGQPSGGGVEWGSIHNYTYAIQPAPTHTGSGGVNWSDPTPFDGFSSSVFNSEDANPNESSGFASFFTIETSGQFTAVRNVSALAVCNITVEAATANPPPIGQHVFDASHQLVVQWGVWDYTDGIELEEVNTLIVIRDGVTAPPFGASESFSEEQGFSNRMNFIQGHTYGLYTRQSSIEDFTGRVTSYGALDLIVLNPGAFPTGG